MVVGRVIKSVHGQIKDSVRNVVFVENPHVSLGDIPAGPDVLVACVLGQGQGYVRIKSVDALCGILVVDTEQCDVQVGVLGGELFLEICEVAELATAMSSC